MRNEALSAEDFSQLLSLTRRVVPNWLRKHHHTLSLANHTAASLLSDQEFRDRFLEAIGKQDLDVVHSIWIKFSRRIGSRLRQRIVRSIELQGEVDPSIMEGDLLLLLDEIDLDLSESADFQSVFREFYVPLVGGSSGRRPSINSVKVFLGTGEAWARVVRDRVENAIREACLEES